MRLLSYSHPDIRHGDVSFGLVDGEPDADDIASVIDLFGIGGATTLDEFVAGGQIRRIVSAGVPDGLPIVPLAEVAFERTMQHPERIFCIGVNYGGRNAEYRDGQDAPQNPSVFVRFPSSLTGHGHALVRPPESEQLDYEGEIVAVIGRGGRRIDRTDALAHVAGFTLGNEGTIRDWVRHAKFNVTQGKNWDASGSMGPWLVTSDELAGRAGGPPDLLTPDDLEALHLTTHVNGELRQDDTPATMAFPIDFQIAYLSTFCTLQPGDVIFTGTPTGAGARFDPPQWLEPGDVVEVSVPEIGTLRNTVRDE